MRELLFRGKRRYTGEWAESVCPLGVMCAGHLCDDFEPETVGQYTGQLDRNGQKIFEGDILRWTAEDGESGTVYVKFDSGVFGLYCSYAPGSEPDLFNDFLDGEQPLEVVGNVHDTPELLWRS